MLYFLYLIFLIVTVKLIKNILRPIFYLMGFVDIMFLIYFIFVIYFFKINNFINIFYCINTIDTAVFVNGIFLFNISVRVDFGTILF